MRRLATLVFAIVILGGCTPGEHAAWARWFQKDPKAAQAEYDKMVQAKPKATFKAVVPAKAPMGSKCPGWYDEAMDAGFSYGQWRTVDRIMWRESRCQQGAHHRSGATGLMQIMPMWADDCGTTVSELRNGSINLRCARHILNVQGWEAWSTY